MLCHYLGLCEEWMVELLGELDFCCWIGMGWAFVEVIFFWGFLGSWRLVIGDEKFGK